MKKRTVKGILALVISISMLAGMTACGGSTTSDSTAADSTAADSTAADSTAADTTTADSATADSVNTDAASTDSAMADSTVADSNADDTTAEKMDSSSEIYTLTERNALSGLVNPDMADRSSIEKALPKEQKGGLKIGLSMGQMGSEFFTAMVDSAQAACDKYGYELTMFNADSNISTQSSDVESMITSGVDAIILNPMDVTAAAADVQTAVDAGIPVIGVGVDFPSDVPVITSILANNYFGGWYTGLYLGEFFEGKEIKAGAILGMMGHTIDESRTNGMIAGLIYKRAELNGKPFATQEEAYLEANDMFNELRDKGSLKSDKWQFEIVAQGEGSWTIEGGLSAAEDIIAGHPDINLMYCCSDPMGQGAITAIEGAGLTPGEDIYVACSADGGKEIFKLLENGKMQVTGYNSPDLNGSAAIDLLHMIFEEEYDASNMPAASDLPNASITKENWKEYYDEKLTYCKILPFTFRTIDEIRADAGL